MVALRQAELDHRAKRAQEACVRGAAAGRGLGHEPGLDLDRLGDEPGKSPGSVRNASPEITARAGAAVPRGDLGDARRQALAVCRSLKRIETRALALAGMTLVAGL
jgi:hypothetical protein